jgi:hypothetical protein
MLLTFWVEQVSPTTMQSEPKLMNDSTAKAHHNSYVLVNMALFRIFT